MKITLPIIKQGNVTFYLHGLYFDYCSSDLLPMAEHCLVNREFDVVGWGDTLDEAKFDVAQELEIMFECLVDIPDDQLSADDLDLKRRFCNKVTRLEVITCES